MPWLKSIFLFCECKEAVLLYNFGYGQLCELHGGIKKVRRPHTTSDPRDPSAHYSCRSEYIQFNLFVEQVAVGKEKTVNEKLIKS